MVAYFKALGQRGHHATLSALARATNRTRSENAHGAFGKCARRILEVTLDKMRAAALDIKQKSKRKRPGAAQAASAFSFFACLRGHPAIRKRLSGQNAPLRVAAELCFAARSFS